MSYVPFIAVNNKEEENKYTFTYWLLFPNSCFTFISALLSAFGFTVVQIRQVEDNGYKVAFPFQNIYNAK